MRFFAAFAVATFFAAIAHSASAGIVEDCAQESDPNLGIDGCTAVIESGMFADSPGDLAKIYYNRGNAYQNLGEHRRAIEDYDQALRIDPGFAIAYSNRGNAYNHLGEYRRAIEDYDQALRLDPGDADYYQNQGAAYESLGDYERAVENWERAIQIGGALRAKWWQEYMTGKGHYSGAVDGIFGPATRRGLMACAIDPDC